MDQPEKALLAFREMYMVSSDDDSIKKWALNSLRQAYVALHGSESGFEEELKRLGIEQ